MKTLLTLILVASLSNSFATVRTVSNDPASPAQYPAIAAAIAAANAGDTIYVHGSVTGYGAISIYKRLTLIGTGARPNKQNPLVSSVASFTLDSVSGVSGASGSVIEGFNFNSNNATIFSTTGNYTAAKPCQNIYFSRNNVSASINNSFNTILGAINNFIINNNIFVFSGGSTGFLINIGNNSNWAIENNIFNYTTATVTPNGITTSNQSSIIIDHNIFIGTGSNYTFSTISFAIFSNNVFWGLAPASSSTSADIASCVFTNNITYQTAKDTIPYGSNFGSGNLINQNPLFVNTPLTSFHSSYDYHLQASSPGHNASTDGTDLGIYGGVYPIPDLTGAPNIPQVTLMNILNSSIPLGGTLNVPVQAQKHK